MAGNVRGPLHRWPRGYPTHGDIQYRNLLVNGHGHPVAVIDSNRANHAPRPSAEHHRLEDGPWDGPEPDSAQSGILHGYQRS